MTDEERKVRLKELDTRLLELVKYLTDAHTGWNPPPSPPALARIKINSPKVYAALEEYKVLHAEETELLKKILTI